MTNTASPRTFIVALMGERGINPIVSIREVEPASCSATLSRVEAWTLANKLAQPLNIKQGRKHNLLNIHFTGLDLITRDLGKPESTTPATPAAKPAPKAAAPAPKAAPVAVKAEPKPIRKGRYAVENEEGVLRFYKLDKPTEGKWAGFTFLKVLASDTEYPVKGASKAAILAKIAADPTAAGARYGREIGKCCFCHKTLTDQQSRDDGMGRDCKAMYC